MAPETLVESVREALRCYSAATPWPAHVTPEAQVRALEAAKAEWSGRRPAPAPQPGTLGGQIRPHLDVIWCGKELLRALAKAPEGAKLSAMADVLEERIVAIKVAAGVS